MKKNVSSLETSSMTSSHWAVGMMFLIQTFVGVLGNFSLLLQYVSRSFTGARLRPTDLILRHLTVANCLVILSKGVTQTTASLGLEDFLGDAGCKVIFYTHRMGRGVSTGSTCLLSVFQMVTLRPWTPRWAELKNRAAKYLDSSLMLNWVLNLLINVMVTVSITDRLGRKNITGQRDLGYCFASFHYEISAYIYITVLSFPDFCSLGIMVWASVSMVSILYRHKKQVQHIHTTHGTPTESPETRATHSILVLLSVFVSLYALSSIFHVYLVLSPSPSWVLVNTSALSAACFPTVCPFVLMRHLPSIIGPCCDTCAPRIIRKD
ncbi:vomeronasal type-1 receptor 4-like [Sorex fumeus]|uniref:vomeronasal type-1 receptor 4-like n=1 Tax=Sorex fumeus TaxID=62283 RepID=UPI0024AE6D59|nr:vomeronasal type-1 receptor 4-like [Sorex fumeus]